jgi:hypothetical protein
VTPLECRMEMKRGHLGYRAVMIGKAHHCTTLPLSVEQVEARSCAYTSALLILPDEAAGSLSSFLPKAA